MKVEGVGSIRRWLIYRAVRLGGWSAWNWHQEQNFRREMDQKLAEARAKLEMRL